MRAAAVQAFLCYRSALFVFVTSATTLRAPCNIFMWTVVCRVILIFITFETNFEAYILFDLDLGGTDAGEKAYESFL